MSHIQNRTMTLESSPTCSWQSPPAQQTPEVFTDASLPPDPTPNPSVSVNPVTLLYHNSHGPSHHHLTLTHFSILPTGLLASATAPYSGHLPVCPQTPPQSSPVLRPPGNCTSQVPLPLVFGHIQPTEVTSGRLEGGRREEAKVFSLSCSAWGSGCTSAEDSLSFLQAAPSVARGLQGELGLCTVEYHCLPIILPAQGW